LIGIDAIKIRVSVSTSEAEKRLVIRKDLVRQGAPKVPYPENSGEILLTGTNLPVDACV
jgi:hypothetical protein